MNGNDATERNTKTVGTILTIFGVLLLVFAIVRYNSPMSQIVSAAGGSDPLPLILALVGSVLTLGGVLALFGALNVSTAWRSPVLSDIVYCLLRLLSGLMLATHGAQKAFGMFGGKVAAAPHMMFAGWVELVGGLLIAVGLLTRPAAFLCSGLMAVAYFMAHAGQGWHPVMNRGELAVLYCFWFLFVFFNGPRRWSVDAIMRGNRAETTDARV